MIPFILAPLWAQPSTGDYASFKMLGRSVVAYRGSAECHAEAASCVGKRNVVWASQFSERNGQAFASALVGQ